VVPVVRPVTTHDVVDVVQVKLPGVDVTVYPVIGEPLASGVPQATLAEVEDATFAETLAGASGGVAISSAADAVEDGLVPIALVAVTVKV